MPLATLLQRWQPAGQKSYKTTKGEVCSCGVCQAKEIVCRSEKGKDWIFFLLDLFFLFSSKLHKAAAENSKACKKE